MRNEIRLSIIVLLFVLNVNGSCSDVSEHDILKTIKNVVISFHEDTLDGVELENIDKSLVKKNCDSDPLVENYESEVLYFQIIYKKNSDRKLKQVIESIIVQIKEEDHFILVNDLVEIFGKWIFRTKRAKKSFVSFVYNPDNRDFKTKIKCTDIFWKDLVKTLILTKVAVTQQK